MPDKNRDGAAGSNSGSAAGPEADPIRSWRIHSPGAARAASPRPRGRLVAARAVPSSRSCRKAACIRQIAALSKHPPEERIRDARIVLQDGGALCEHTVPNHREGRVVRHVRGRFQEGRNIAELRQVSEEWLVFSQPLHSRDSRKSNRGCEWRSRRRSQTRSRSLCFRISWAPCRLKRVPRFCPRRRAVRSGTLELDDGSVPATGEWAATARP